MKYDSIYCSIALYLLRGKDQFELDISVAVLDLKSIPKCDWCTQFKWIQIQKGAGKNSYRNNSMKYLCNFVDASFVCTNIRNKTIKIFGPNILCVDFNWWISTYFRKTTVIFSFIVFWEN